MPKTSAYSRSRAFRWGVWMLAIAAVLIAWNLVKEKMIAKAENLRTVEGTVVDYTSHATSQRYLGGGSGKRFRGSTGATNVLRIQTPNGNVTEFSSSIWIRPPKYGWQKGQPISVKHDSLRDLYEVVVADETLQDIESTRRTRGERSKAVQPFAAVFLLIGVPLTAIGFLLSRKRTDQLPPPLPTAPPPVPGSSASPPPLPR